MDHLLIDQLIENIRLLIKLHQVLVKAGPFHRILVISLLNLLLQLIISPLVEQLDESACLEAQAIIGGQFLIGLMKQRYSHPHLRHGQQTQQELIGI